MRCSEKKLTALLEGQNLIEALGYWDGGFWIDPFPYATHGAGICTPTFALKITQFCR